MFSGHSPTSDNVSAGGIDTLHVAVYGRWDAKAWKRFRNEVEAAQKESKEGEQGWFPDGQGGAAVVMPHGTRHGPWCQFVFQWSGVTFHVVDRSEFDPESLSIFVEMGSLCLMEMGHRAAWAAVCDFLKRLGFEVCKAVPSRLDVCVDVVGVHAAEFVELFHRSCYVSRARKWAVYGEGREATGVRIGSDVQLRIYDKLREAKQGDPRKLAVLEARRWGGRPKAATRVEFQLRRGPLRDQFNVQTVNELFSKLASICEWLVEDWFRFTEEPPDRDGGNQRRYKVHPLWLRVANAFRAWTGEVSEIGERRPRVRPVVDRLKRQAVGVLESIAALAGDVPGSVEEVLRHVERVVRPVLSEMLQGIAVKRQRFAAQEPVAWATS